MRSDVTAACRWLVQLHEPTRSESEGARKRRKRPDFDARPFSNRYAAHFVRGICHFAERLDGTGKM